MSGLRSLPWGVDRGRQGPDGAEPQSGMLLKPAPSIPPPTQKEIQIKTVEGERKWDAPPPHCALPLPRPLSN